MAKKRKIVKVKKNNLNIQEFLDAIHKNDVALREIMRGNIEKRDEQIRMQCLGHAAAKSDLHVEAETIIKKADAFYKFVKGEAKKEVEHG